MFRVMKREKSTSNKEKSKLREWVDSMIFAIFAAIIIRSLVVEAFTIPTASMEKSLLIGDFLFVSKMHYGARIPETPISVPFVHNTLPFSERKSYLESVKIPYLRLPGFQKIRNNDVIVFNYPMEDYRPVDRRENYIKRCIAIAGDTFEIQNGFVFINRKKIEERPHQQQEYSILTDGTNVEHKILEHLDVTEFSPLSNPGEFRASLTSSVADSMRRLKNVKSVNEILWPKGIIPEMIFPKDPLHFQWYVDNYGPIYIPKKGATIKIDTNNIALYQRIIRIYENHTLDIKQDGRLFIDGRETDEYTFAMNYYWMMGDNRHNSLDSRYWGFVPEDHIVGKAWFVWMSWNEEASGFKKIRWDRLFHSIQ